MVYFVLREGAGKIRFSSFCSFLVMEYDSDDSCVFFVVVDVV